MIYSKTHQEFANRLGEQDALTNPEHYLGPNYRTVLDFWWFLEGLSVDQFNEVARRYREIPDAARDAAGSAAWDAAWYAVGHAARYVARDATLELIGMHILLEQGKTLTFVPLFNNLN